MDDRSALRALLVASFLGLLALALLSFYSIVTLAAWVCFRGRVYGWSMPTMPGRRRPRS